MSIQTGDVKLLKSQVLLDTTDGGGAMTANEVVDGQSNNLFPDISELDRVYGRVALRKTFLAIQTNTNDSYYGSQAIVARVPSDPRVNVSLFTTKDWFDRRSAARDKIERYLARGPKWAGHLLERQLDGQRAIQLSLDPRDDEPTVGQGLALVQFEGLNNEYEQYVRVSKVTSVSRTFSIQGRDVIRKISTVEITDPLRYTFDGITVAEFLNNQAALASCRDTRVANAATYYGAVKLQQPAVINDAAITAQGIFAQLVPSATSETPMVDLNAASMNSLLAPGNSGNILLSAGVTFGPLINVYIGSSVMPGSLTLTAGGNTVVDAGGALKIGSTAVGEIEYDKGLLRFNSAAPSYSGSATFNFKPAAKPTQVADTASISITQDSRGFNYTITLRPIPAPGTLTVSYMAQGKVYYLYERGDGVIRGTDTAFGTGTLNFVTGSVVFTAGALPDADSELIFSWGRSTTTFARADTVVPPSRLRLQLSKQGIAPSTLTLTWMVGAATKTATDDGNGGLSGDATGVVNYVDGTCIVQTSALIGKNTQVTCNYQWGAPNEFTQATSTPNGNGDYVIQLPNLGAVIPQSVEVLMDVDVTRASGTFTEVEYGPTWGPEYVAPTYFGAGTA